MRWLKEYPITANEAMAALESIPQVNPPGTPPEQTRIGGIEDTIRHQIIEYFQNPENMNNLLEHFKNRYRVSAPNLSESSEGPAIFCSDAENRTRDSAL